VTCINVVTIFFPRLPHTPRSTLFPYTTLFRSPDNLIIVGTPTWSQDVDVASNDPITGYSNIAYTLHFYAGTHGQFLRDKASTARSEEHTSELQSRENLVCRLLLEKKKNTQYWT